MMRLDSDIKEIKGIGEKSAAVFAKASVFTVNDLIRYFPRGYEEFHPPKAFEDLQEEEVSAVAAFVTKQPTVVRSGRYQITNLTVTENDVSLQLRWFHMPFLRNTLKRGFLYIFRGRIIKKGKNYWMEQPKIYSPAEYRDLEGRMMPVYPLVSGLTNQMISRSVKRVMEQIPAFEEDFPEELRKRYRLAEYNYVLSNIHFPSSKEDLVTARRRIVFEEFYQFICRIRSMKEQWELIPNHCRMEPVEETEKLLKMLPYELTGAQKKVWKEISADLQGPKLMSRLIQGDVGSGKTILAFLALLTACKNGYQGAMMAPTEVLAKQHFEGLMELKERYGLAFHGLLLVGSMTAKEKRLAYEEISSGRADIVIGTHALIQDKVEFSKLGLVITDEQHRFGVKQREIFSQKGQQPHVLVMSATPIPRTLAIIIYGDLDISVIDEMPANRIPIKNCVVDDSWRPKAYGFIKKEIAAGHQAYVICPMVEENEELELENVIDYAKKLEKELPDIRVAYLHGKMKAQEKNEIMEAFGRNEIQVLVSTTVIEVGINVPNATVMMVENAERFGLSQLHQLRGRVGRGNAQSYCIFMSNSKGKDTKKRLEILNQSNDGFYIASEDLKLRGPGDLFGIRQSGDLRFTLGDIFTDAEILKEACEAAQIYGQYAKPADRNINL